MEMRLIAIVGPTASGKTGKAVALARVLDGEIVSGDSRQVYRHMDLGTGKDLDEYGDIPYHLIDICEAGEKYNLHRYLSDFNRAVADIRRHGRLPIVCGGSGMYVETALSGISLPDVEANDELRTRLSGKTLEELTDILKGYKTLHNTTDIDTEKRAIRAIEIEEYYREHPDEARKSRRGEVTPHDSLIVGIDVPRDVRRKRISERLDRRLQAGMVEEVASILRSGVKADDLIYYGLEYKFLTLHILGKLTYEEMRSQLEIAIHQFAKRQMTWLRGMERRGMRIHWLPYDLPDSEFIDAVKVLLATHNP